MNIGIIGSGAMGSGFAKHWSITGHTVLITSTDLEQTKDVIKGMGPNVGTGSLEETIEFGEVVVFAIPFESIEDVVNSSKGRLKGKVVLECINPLTPDALGLKIGFSTSAAEEVAKLIPESKVVDAFNTIAANVLQSDNHMFGSFPASVYYCGDDEGAKSIVKTLISDIGFEPVDCGPLTNARYLEPMAELIIQLAIKGYGDNIAFNLLRK
jgi:8-hydroxy-5-deazaflavin:NADPH oxidoreductase